MTPEGASAGKPLVVCVLGPPAAGKGTLCRKLANDYGLHHFSLGDHLRSLARDENCPVREDIVELFRLGGLFPIEFLSPLLRDKLTREYQNGSRAVILDGFPRSAEQLYGYEDCKDFDIVVFCNCPAKLVQERYLSRKLPGRLDDDERLFNARYEEYERLNPEVVQFFKHKGVLIEIDTSGSIEDTYSALLSKLKENQNWKTILARQT